MYDSEAEDAFRHRIQSQALFHLVNQGVSGRVILPFVRAGTWSGDISGGTPDAVKKALLGNPQEVRAIEEVGPLLVVNEPRGLGIVDVKESLLSDDREVRCAAVDYFESARDAKPHWVSPFVLQLLKSKRPLIDSTSADKWAEAGLELIRAIECDFRINLAGARQSRRIRHNDMYQEYLDLVLRPPARSFLHDAPELANPVDRRALIESKITEWAELKDLSTALQQYFEYCGFVPLGNGFSAGALVDAWARRNDYVGLADVIWDWAMGASGPLPDYHAVAALLQYPKWIPNGETTRLIAQARSIIAAPSEKASETKAVLWRVRRLLVRHYQCHVEAFSPGMDGEVVALTVCWLAEQVAEFFGVDPQGLEKVCNVLRERELSLSERRWGVARSRMSPSPLRNANLFSVGMWGDSLIAPALRACDVLPASEEVEVFRDSFLEQAIGVMCYDGLATRPQDEQLYAFEEAIAAAEIQDDADTNSEVNGDESPSKSFITSQFVKALTELQGEQGVRRCIEQLAGAPEGISIFYCGNLRSQIVSKGGEMPFVADFLVKNDWRSRVFQELSLSALELLTSFLIEWQLQQEADWQVRLPHVFAIECEAATDVERQTFLLAATVLSSAAVDVASPLMRLLGSSKRSELIAPLKEWCDLLRTIQGNSEPWVAGRIRGLLGSIEAKI